ncbi:MAG: type IV pilus assembly protein PilM [Candidatus Omnitrophica bacterium]|nr:type IV pilus assembly protein PilM [Candidatus Omnitrophota bacterium]
MNEPRLKKIFNAYFGFIRRFIPQTPVGIAAGLDIGSAEYKFVAIKKTKEGFELERWASEPIAGNGDPAQVLGKLISKTEHPPKAVYTALTGKGTLIRFIEMPRMPLDELRNAFSVEADKYFPFPADQIYTDCYILDPAGKGRQMDVMAAAVRKEMADERIKFLLAQGWAGDYLSLNPIALANVVQILAKDTFAAKDEAVGILDMGESGSNLTVMVNGQPRFCRDIFIGGLEFTRRLSQALSLNPAEAVQLRNQPGDRLEAVMGVYEAPAQNLIREIRLSFDYFSTENDQDVKAVYLTGGGALIPGIVPVLQNQMDSALTVWNPLQYLKIPASISAAEVESRGVKFGAALGLALADYD